jgi:cellulose synthase/poly-beta-1,6-N-acetylglucosamine synthase-like glycosyltransferase
MVWIFLLFGLLYSGLIFYFFIGIYRIPRTENGKKLTVSILVPARNEQEFIGNCIESLWNQTYDKQLYTVYIIDDQSTDRTAEVIRSLIKDKPNFYLLSHKVLDKKSTFKKEALKFALKSVTSEVVVTIDADTVAQPDWLEKMVSYYDEKTGLVAGLVTFFPQSENNLFHKIQTLEFAGIVFCGVGSLGNNNPLICNGSNLSYRMKAYNDVGGYDGNMFLPSGDDDLLLQNIFTKTDWKVKYALSKETINYTTPVKTFTTFLNQRARWASKSIHYPRKWMFPMMLSIYLYYLLIIILFPLTLYGQYPVDLYLLGLSLKIIPEILLIRKGLKILGRGDLIKYFFVAQFFQIIYIIIAGLMGFLRQYSWKGDKQ